MKRLSEAEAAVLLVEGGLLDGAGGITPEGREVLLAEVQRQKGEPLRWSAVPVEWLEEHRRTCSSGAPSLGADTLAHVREVAHGAVASYNGIEVARIAEHALLHLEMIRERGALDNAALGRSQRMLSRTVSLLSEKSFVCPTCGALKGWPCTQSKGERRARAHWRRVKMAWKLIEPLEGVA
jgi:hypothetical protein